MYNIVFLTIKSSIINKVPGIFLIITFNLGIRIVRYVHHLCSYYYDIMVMLLDIVELQQLPLLLLLKLHVRESRSRAAAAVVVCRCVPDDAICCCVFSHLIQINVVSFSLFKHD